MKAWMVAAILAGTIANGNAMADGKRLLEYCQTEVRLADSKGVGVTKSDYFNMGYCFGVLDGVTSLGKITNAASPKQTQTCMPSPAVNRDQVVRVLVKFMTDNPEKLSLNEGVITVMALQHAYPCK